MSGIPPANTLDRWFRSVVLARLRSFRSGSLNIVEHGRCERIGTDAGELTASLYVHHPRFYRRVALGGGLGAAEALMDGDWRSDDLTALVRLFIRNLEVSDRLDRGLAWLRRTAARAAHGWRHNTRRGAARNIREHYDLGNEFFSLFLDETLSYSCGVFTHPEATLEEASLTKIDRACRKLNLQPTDHLLEIGSGWGALAIYAARQFGCRVTTATISPAQFKLASQRVRQAGLSDRVEVVLSDYRDLQGQYDKLVSIEMIEAVGHEYFPTFFATCDRLLKPHGMLLLQGIVIRDQRYRQHLRSVDFIRRYIFPGGCLPSVSVLLASMTRASELRLLQLEDLAPHYAETLRRWRDNFHARLDEVRSLGYPERFVRMWNYYLCYCEAVFEERQVNNVQMLFAKPACRFDPITASFSAEPGRSDWERSVLLPRIQRQEGATA